ncbi:MAG TPA: hypothetical protein VNG93_05925 [Candidatus Dormibacteraeota bacterium]|nr:hypothetical protein [Candidatus Dormibacteraeota bacterium]
MGASSDEITRQIAETRDEIEGKIVTLRERGEVAVRRGKRLALIAAGVGAGIAVVGIGAFIVYRMTRPASTRERIERVIPTRWWERVISLRRTVEEGVRRQVPPMRVYVGDRQGGEEPPSSNAQKIALRLAQAAGTAIGGAIVQRLMQRFERAA